jgi:hypothetical protein
LWVSRACFNTCATQIKVLAPKSVNLKVRFQEAQLKTKEKEGDKNLRTSKNPWASALKSQHNVGDSRDAIYYDEDSSPNTTSSISSDDGDMILTPPDSGDGHVSGQGKSIPIRLLKQSKNARPATISIHGPVTCPSAPTHNSSQMNSSMSYDAPNDSRGHLAKFLREVGSNTGKENTEDRDEEDRNPRKRTLTRRAKKADRELACPYYKMYPHEEMIDKKCLAPRLEAHRIKWVVPSSVSMDQVILALLSETICSKYIIQYGVAKSAKSYSERSSKNSKDMYSTKHANGKKNDIYSALLHYRNCTNDQARVYQRRAYGKVCSK